MSNRSNVAHGQELINRLIMFELPSGKTVLGERDIEGEAELSRLGILQDSSILLKNPRAIMQKSKGGINGASVVLELVPWMSGGRIQFNVYQAVAQLVDDVPHDLYRAYVKSTTGLEIASPADIPNGGKIIS